MSDDIKNTSNFFVDAARCVECNDALLNDPTHCFLCDLDQPALKADDIQAGGDHYKTMAIQPWHLMEVILTPEEFRGYLRGNVIKYGMRAGRKEGSDDAAKAKHYIQKLKEFDANMQKMRN